MQRTIPAGQTSTTTYQNETFKAAGLDVLDCEKCENRGYIIWRGDNFETHFRECECMAKRRSIRRIRRSNMEDMLERYTFDAYQTPDEHRRKIKERARQYIDQSDGWFYVSGRSGSGKTHICTAVCKALIDKGVETYYMDWQRESSRIRLSMKDREYYEDTMQKLCTVPALYIDDLFKKGNEFDVKLAFEIVHARYNNKKHRTNISSEITLRGLFEVDEALAGRIYERTRGGYAILTPNENWRIREMEAKPQQ